MDYTQEYRREVEEIRRNERSLLIHFVAEKYDHNQIRVKIQSPAELISRSLMSIRAEYANVIKKHYGGWTCGTHASKVEERLRRIIIERYEESQINRFIDFCLTTHEANDIADADIREMIEYLVSIRPKPFVNLLASHLRNTADDTQN